MSYTKYTKEIKKMRRDFMSERTQSIVHCPTGVTMERCHQLDSWVTNKIAGSKEGLPARTRELRSGWHETKAKFNNDDMNNVPLVYSESLRHDTLRADLVKNIKQMITDDEHPSKRLSYFSSTKLRYELFLILVLATVDNETVSASYISNIFNESNSSVRRELKICLEAGWIVEHKIDNVIGYMATSETVNTYYHRLRRLFIGKNAVSANSLLRMSNFASLCSYEDDFNSKFPHSLNPHVDDSENILK